jgi:hypothetical protein
MVKLDKNRRPYPVRADGYRDLPTARTMTWTVPLWSALSSTDQKEVLRAIKAKAEVKIIPVESRAPQEQGPDGMPKNSGGASGSGGSTAMGDQQGPVSGGQDGGSTTVGPAP